MYKSSVDESRYSACVDSHGTAKILGYKEEETFVFCHWLERRISRLFFFLLFEMGSPLFFNFFFFFFFCFFFFFFFFFFDAILYILIGDCCSSIYIYSQSFVWCEVPL